MEIEPFTIAMSDRDLDDLRGRLERTRWPAPLPVADGAGVSVPYLRQLLDYWRNGFDWRAREADLNALPHYRARVGDVRVHFVHRRGVGPDPLPLVLTHGWPSAFTEMVRILPLLTNPGDHGGDPADAFDVVVPSLPGYGFSDPMPGLTGGAFSRTARLWHELLTEGLGYALYGAAGWDLGAAVSNRLGVLAPESVVGMYVPGIWKDPDDGRPLTEEERAFVERRDAFGAAHGAYAAMQSTRPQTLTYGLHDSPAGLAAWIVEKYRDWSDCDGDVERRFGKDELLTLLSIYWLTGTVGTSFLPYHDREQTPLPRIEVPVGVGVFPADLPSPPRSWVERSCHVVHWTRFPRGGHFPAAEEPELLAADLRAFFRPLR